MALSKYMHPRNIYKNNPLSVQTLKGFCDEMDKLISESESFHLDFSSPKHLGALTKTLLKRDFLLDIDILPERLIPTVPLRLNYILWLEDIVSANQHFFNDSLQIFDIGIGACCIYPLIGTKNSKWNFFGSEIDSLSFHYAQKNVIKNNLEERIKIFTTENKDEYFTDLFKHHPDAQIDFVMSNPPFFASQSEAVGAETTRTDRRPKPSSFSTAALHESQTMGGEIYFTFKLAKESLKYKDRIKVVTVMLGKKSSVRTVKKMLRGLKINSFSIYEFCQGRVMRWGIAWSLSGPIKFPISEFKAKRKLVKPMKMEISRDNTFLANYNSETILGWLENEFRQLDMDVFQQKNRSSIGGHHLLIKASKNTWIHSRKKRRQTQQNLTKSTEKMETSLEDEMVQPQAKKPRLTEEQNEESSAWTDLSKYILVTKVHVNSDNTQTPVAGDSSDSENELNPVENQNSEQKLNFHVHFHLVDSDNSKDLLNQLILYLRNRMNQ